MKFFTPVNVVSSIIILSFFIFDAYVATQFTKEQNLKRVGLKLNRFYRNGEYKDSVLPYDSIRSNLKWYIISIAVHISLSYLIQFIGNLYNRGIALRIVLNIAFSCLFLIGMHGYNTIFILLIIIVNFWLAKLKTKIDCRIFNLTIFALLCTDWIFGDYVHPLIENFVSQI